VDPAADKEPMIRVIPSLLKEKVQFIIFSSPSPTPFRSIEILFIDYSTPIPDYFNDSRLLIHLAFALYPQFGDQALKKIALEYLDSEEEDVNVDMSIDDDEKMISANKEAGEESEKELEILEEVPAVFTTPKKKKTVKVKEQLDDSFLRRSNRLSIKADGYKDAKSAKKAKEPVITDARPIKKKNKKAGKSKTPAESEEEPVPLAMIPPSITPAPYLPQEVLQGIGEGFLQIQPESVSAALLKHDDIDE
jgi:hypothetical protein